MTRRPRQSFALARRRAERRPSYRLARGVLVTAILGLVGLFAIKAYDGVPTKDYGKLYVEVPDVGNLREHDQVRISGARVGQVMTTEITQDGRARVELQIEPSTGDLPRDTEVSVRAAGLLGARYVELLPGRSAEVLADGATIEGGPNAKTYGVPEALNVFDDETRGALGDMVRDTGTALLGNGEPLNEGIEDVSAAQEPWHRLLGTILDEGRVERLVPSVTSMMRPLDASRDDIAAMFAPVRRAIRPFSQEQPAVERTLEEAPSALGTMTRGLAGGRTLLASVRDVSRAADRVLPRAPGGLRAATALLQESPRPLDAARDLLDRTEQAVPGVLDITGATGPLLDPMAQGLRSLVPINQKVGEYRCDLEIFAANYRSFTGFAVPGPTGNVGQIRLTPIVTPIENVGFDAEDSGIAPRDPYPEPCKYFGEDSTQGGRFGLRLPTGGGR